MKTKTSVYVLIILLGLLAIGAIVGGGALIISPGGELLRMPLSILGTSPFKDFLIPGLILFFILGIIPGILVFVLLKKPNSKIFESLNFYKDMYWGWSFCIYISFALIIWIQIEMVYLQIVVWAHTFYMFYALVMIFITLLPQIRNQYRKEEIP
jgi:hypothetical protein